MSKIIYKNTTAVVGDGLRCTMSVPSPDSYKDIVGTGKPDAFVMNRFLDNPASFLNHATTQPPIGRWENVRVESDGALRGTLHLAPRSSSARMREVHSLVDAKILKGISIGFFPLQAEPRRDSKEGLHYRVVELVEASLVGIPAHPQALVHCKQLGISEATQREVFRQYTLAERIRQAKRADPGRDLSRIASDLRFAEGQKRFEVTAAEALANLQPQIIAAYQRHTDAVLARDLAAQLRAMRMIERLERMETFYKNHLPKPPPPPPKPMSRTEQWTASQEKARKDSEAASARFLAQQEANWNRAQGDALRQSLEDFRDEEAARRDKKK